MVLQRIYHLVKSSPMETLRTYLSTLAPEQQAMFAIKAGTTIGYLRKAMSKRHRFDGALARRLDEHSGGLVSRSELRPDIFDPPATTSPRTAYRSAPGDIATAIDCRMSKRALRARLGVTSDKQLATVLRLSTEEVEGWGEETVLPAVPEVLFLLGVQPEPEQVERAPDDPEAGRIVHVEVA